MVDAARAARRLPWEPALIGLTLVVAGLLPVLVGLGQLFLWETILIQIVFALSVNFLIGNSGVATFGQAAFYGAGAYTVAALTGQGVATGLALLAAVVAAGLGAAVVGLLVVRIAGIGVAMLTLAIAQGGYVLVDRSSVMGGDNGTTVTLAGWPAPGSLEFWYLSLGICMAAVAALWWITRSPFGLVMRAVRDDPLRALHMGISVTRARWLAFVVSGAFAGLAGGLYGCLNQYVTPDSLNWTTSGAPLIMAVIGGIYTFWGPAVGVVVYLLLNNVFSSVAPTIWILFVGLVLLGVVALAPEGLLSVPERVRRWRR